MGTGSYENPIKRWAGKTIGGKLESVRHPAVVAKNIDGQGLGAKRTVSRT